MRLGQIVLSNIEHALVATAAYRNARGLGNKTNSQSMGWLSLYKPKDQTGDAASVFDRHILDQRFSQPTGYCLVTWANLETLKTKAMKQ